MCLHAWVGGVLGSQLPNHTLRVGASCNSQGALKPKLRGRGERTRERSARTLHFAILNNLRSPRIFKEVDQSTSRALSLSTPWDWATRPYVSQDFPVAIASQASYSAKSVKHTEGEVPVPTRPITVVLEHATHNCMVTIIWFS